jgi:hypothetical protein
LTQKKNRKARSQERRAAASQIRYARARLESTARQVLATSALSEFSTIDGRLQRVPNAEGAAYIAGAQQDLDRARAQIQRAGSSRSGEGA